MNIRYEAEEDISVRFQVSFSNFKNPVNQREKEGFSLTTLDQDGFLINVSERDLILVANLTELAFIGDREMSMLGDVNGSNIGRIGTYQ